MLAQLPAPQPLIAPPAHQRRRHYPAALKHPIPLQHPSRAIPLRLGIEKREDRRPAPGHPAPARRVSDNLPRIVLSWGYCLKTTVSKSFALSALAALAERHSPSARTKAWKLLMLLDDPVKSNLAPSA